MKAISKKRDAIIRATVELAAEKGINGATTVLIAEKAQTAEVTIFRQFKTKEALLHTIFDEQLGNIQKFLLVDHDETLPIKDRFIDFATKMLRYFLDKPLELSFMEQYIHTPIGWERRPDMLYSDGENFEDYPLISLASEGVEQKAIKNLPMPALIGMIIGPLGAFARECHLKGLEFDEQGINDVVLASWDGIEA